MLKEKRDNQDPSYAHLPVSLFPMPYPTELFVQACDMQKPFARVVAGLVRDPEENISGVLAAMRKLDPFMDRLLQISEAVNLRRAQGLKVQNIQACLLRSDYMIDWPQDTHAEPALKLVEFNTVACGMLPVTARTSQMQEYVAAKYGSDFTYNYENQGDSLFFARQDSRLRDNFILNPSQSQIDQEVLQFVKALDFYRSTVPEHDGRPWVLFVIEDIERNTAD